MMKYMKNQNFSLWAREVVVGHKKSDLSTMTTITTPTLHADVQSILASVGQYDPASIPQLEAYVRAQVVSVTSALVSSPAPYSVDANRALIKLYQFFPHHLLATATDGEDDGISTAAAAAASTGDEITTLIAFLSIIRYPRITDFGSTINCLLPERAQIIEPTATLAKCHELLDSSDYANFWPEFRKLGIPEYGSSAAGGTTTTGGGVSMDRQLLSNAVNSPLVTNMLRRNIISMLARTYRTIPMAQLLSALDIQDTASLLLEFGTKTVAGDGDGIGIIDKVMENDMVSFTHNVDNTKRVGNAYKEGVTYDDIAMMMSNNKKKKSTVVVRPQ